MNTQRTTAGLLNNKKNKRHRAQTSGVNALLKKTIQSISRLNNYNVIDLFIHAKQLV